MIPFDLLTLALATWFWAYVLTHTDGPFGLFEIAREKLPHGRRTFLVFTETDTPTIKNGEKKALPGLLDCAYCVAIWIAALVVLAPHGVFTDLSAVAGLAMLLHGFTGHRFNT